MGRRSATELPAVRCTAEGEARNRTGRPPTQKFGPRREQKGLSDLDASLCRLYMVDFFDSDAVATKPFPRVLMASNDPTFTSTSDR